ncbi:hypothetical protein OEG84_19805 [Hoeflea sp. G2-23]|uniref:Transcriptional regulator n=1 Tax=Hoeflea algicola TaxID=2983763 RepID=A0ABT3ZE10_9HYPH|nr:hypothetical protein [Hoeflea algicola]MCY0149883.1 hypothetical protein [Hoeflea algicola]
MSDGGTPHDEASALDQAGLVLLLVKSLEALASAGQVDAACRLAGQACAGLRNSDPRGWGRLNALLHRLARRAPEVGTVAASRDR